MSILAVYTASMSEKWGRTPSPSPSTTKKLGKIKQYLQNRKDRKAAQRAYGNSYDRRHQAVHHGSSMIGTILGVVLVLLVLAVIAGVIFYFLNKRKKELESSKRNHPAYAAVHPRGEFDQPSEQNPPVMPQDRYSIDTKELDHRE